MLLRVWAGHAHVNILAEGSWQGLGCALSAQMRRLQTGEGQAEAVPPGAWMGRQEACTSASACFVPRAVACFLLGARGKPVWEQVGLGC